MRLHHFAGLCALPLLPALASAQVLSPGPIVTANGSVAPGGVTPVHTDDFPVNASTASMVAMTDVGDAAYLLSRTPQTATLTIGQYLPFSIGPTPTQITNLTLILNLKNVNGGGTVTSPVSTSVISAGVYEQVGPTINLGTDPLALGLSQEGILGGNGFQILNTNLNSGPAKYVLSPGANYYLYMDQVTTVDNSSFNVAKDPTVSFTTEYGGDLSNGTFTGFAASFQWQTVPEPATPAILAGCAVFLFRRQRNAR
jgi:hypothetical protein